MTVSQLTSIVDFFNEPRVLKIFEKVLIGRIAEKLLPSYLRFLFRAWDKLDDMEREVKACLRLLEAAQKK